MVDRISKLPPELFVGCIHSFISTSSARIIQQKDHTCYQLQPSLVAVNSEFRTQIEGLTRKEQFVKVHYAAADELSPTWFIPVVSTRASALEDLSLEDNRKIFLAYVSVCSSQRDGKQASQDTRSRHVVVTLDSLSFWLAVLASKQYTRVLAGSVALTIDVKIWGEGRKPDWRNNLYHALSLLRRESVQLSGSLGDGKIDAEDIWRLQHPLTPLDAVLLRKSWLDHALRHGLLLTIFRNKDALQIMCSDVMQHFNVLRSTDETEHADLRRGLVPVLCSLMLTWFFYYQHQTFQGNYLDATEDQVKIKRKEANCDAESCPCVLFHMLKLPDAKTLLPSPEILLKYGIDELAGRKMCWLSLLIHHISWQSDEAGHPSHRSTCLDSLKKLRGMYETLEDDQFLDKDIEVLTVAVEHGIQGFDNRPDLDAVHAVDDDDDSDDDDPEKNRVWNRLSVCKAAVGSTVWLVREGGIKSTVVQSNAQKDVSVMDIFDIPLLQEIRDQINRRIYSEVHGDR